MDAHRNPPRWTADRGVGLRFLHLPGRQGDPQGRLLEDRLVARQLLWIGSIHLTASGCSTGSMSRLTTTASPLLRTRTHSRVSSREALISWCGTNGGT